MALKSQRITATGTWTVPAGVTGIFVSGSGGGEGGSGGKTFVGGGGGAAGCFFYGIPLKVTPGESLAIKIGAGGAGGVFSSIASAGTETTVKRIYAEGGTHAASPAPEKGGFGGGAGYGVPQGSARINNIANPRNSRAPHIVDPPPNTIVAVTGTGGYFGGAAGGSSSSTLADAPGMKSAGQLGGITNSNANQSWVGAGGGSTPESRGGTGGDNIAHPTSPTANSGAGGGGGAASALGFSTGATGADGWVLIQWAG